MANVLTRISKFSTARRPHAGPVPEFPQSMGLPAVGVAGVVVAGLSPDASGVLPVNGSWQVHVHGGLHAARCAASCLVLPCIDDTVLLTQVNAQWWITAVLVAVSRERAVLHIPGVHELVLDAPVLTLQTQQACRVRGPLVDVETQKLEVQSDSARFTASAVHLVARFLNVMAEHIQSFSTQLSSSCRVRTVQVEEIDSLTAGHVVTQAQTSSLHAEQVMVNAKETVRLDGERIMVG